MTIPDYAAPARSGGIAALLRSNAGIGTFAVLSLLSIILALATGLSFYLAPCPLFFTLLLVGIILRAPAAWAPATLLCITMACLGIGLGLTHFKFPPQPQDVTIAYVTGMLSLGLAAMGACFALIEYGVMRLLALFRLGAVARITYYEALLQPFTLIVLASGIICIGVCARIGFFTYNEDFKMYRDMASSFVCLFALPIMVFASTKVVDEEIENRTMLTLMSKPISRTQVVIGKYLGVLALVLMAVVVLGIMAGVCSYLRFFDDMSIDLRIASVPERQRLYLDDFKAILALAPSLVLTFLQVATLAAISVAVSTRFGLAVNITTVVIIYMAANLSPYLAGSQDLPGPVRVVISGLSYMLPGLSSLDLNQRLVFGDFYLGDADFKMGIPSYATIWKYTGLAVVYAVFYVGAALSFGIALFRTRELS